MQNLVSIYESAYFRLTEIGLWIEKNSDKEAPWEDGDELEAMYREWWEGEETGQDNLAIELPGSNY